MQILTALEVERIEEALEQALELKDAETILDLTKLLAQSFKMPEGRN